MVLGGEDSLVDLLDASQDAHKAKERMIAEVRSRRVAIEEHKLVRNRRLPAFVPTLASVPESSKESQLENDVNEAEQRATARVDALVDQGQGHSPQSEPGPTLQR